MNQQLLAHDCCTHSAGPGFFLNHVCSKDACKKELSADADLIEAHFTHTLLQPAGFLSWATRQSPTIYAACFVQHLEQIQPAWPLFTADLSFPVHFVSSEC
jgi:hypothetical protein